MPASICYDFSTFDLIWIQYVKYTPGLLKFMHLWFDWSDFQLSTDFGDLSTKGKVQFILLRVQLH